MLALLCLSLLTGAIDAQSSCNKLCPAIYSPVCGSNGKTYSSACSLSTASCQYQQGGGMPVYQTHSGSCSGGNILGGILGGSAACDQICDEVRSPLCASDGVVYENRCKFIVAQCEAAKNGTRISIVSYTSVCHTPIEPNCEKYAVNTSDLAIEGQVSGGVKIVCPHNGHEVCSTHGTFHSECQLCQTLDKSITNSHLYPGHYVVPDYKILYDGPCHSASSNYPGGPIYPNGPYYPGYPILNGGPIVNV